MCAVFFFFRFSFSKNKNFFGESKKIIESGALLNERIANSIWRRQSWRLFFCLLQLNNSIFILTRCNFLLQNRLWAVTNSGLNTLLHSHIFCYCGSFHDPKYDFKFTVRKTVYKNFFKCDCNVVVGPIPTPHFFKVCIVDMLPIISKLLINDTYLPLLLK